MKRMPISGRRGGGVVSAIATAFAFLQACSPKEAPRVEPDPAVQVTAPAAVVPQIKVAQAKVEEGAPVYPAANSRATQTPKEFLTINRILLDVPGVPPPAGGGARPTLTLAANEIDSPGHQSVLSREIFRQALLIAARDELGMATRDAAIGDPVDASSGRVIGDFASDSFFHLYAFATLRIGTAAAPEIIIDDTYFEPLEPTNPYGIKPNHVTRYPRLVEGVEASSRGRLVHALKRAGCAGKPAPARSDAAVTEAVEDDLARPSLLAQFAAVRDLHDAIHRDGESPRLLGALVRGYAQLGVLTEFHWNAAHEAYKARALLYAQRLVARDPASPWGLRHRAFAFALVGLHAPAMADLKAADREAESPKADAPAFLAQKPEWADLIASYCRHDRAALARPASPRLAGLSALLGFLEVEYSNAPALLIETARAALEAFPDCARINDGVCRSAGVGTQHWATELGPAALTAALARQLPEIPGFPAAAKETLVAGDEPAMTRALVAAGAPGVDPGEPSWSVLAGMIRETRFVQSWRRLNFMRKMWGVPVDEELEAIRPLVADHPYRNFIETFALDPVRQPKETAALVKEITPRDLDVTLNPMLELIRVANPERANKPAMMTRNHDDFTARDQLIEMSWHGAGHPPGNAASLLEVSPGAPAAIAALIRDAWPVVEKEAPKWEEAYSRSPEVLNELAKKYAELKRREDSERCLKAYLSVSPDRLVFETLADSQLAGGDAKGWRETLDGALKQPDYGLDHMMISGKLAQHLMREKQWKEALPYAEESAESGAATGMLILVACYEGLHEWDKANAVLRGMVERYPDSTWPLWLLWCARTGHGDLKAAERSAAGVVTALGAPQNLIDLGNVAYFYDWSGQPRKAIPAFVLHFQNSNAMMMGSCIAVLADEAKDFALRDRVLAKLVEMTVPAKPGEQRPAHDPKAQEAAHRFNETIRTWLSGGADGAPDLKVIDEALAPFEPGSRGGLQCLVARLLASHGRKADSLVYFQRSAATPETIPWLRTMAIRAARKGGIELSDEDVAAP